MGNKQTNEKLDQQRLLAFQEKYTDLGDRQDERYGKVKLYEDKTGYGTNKEKVVSKTVEPSSEDDFVKYLQLMRRREEIRSPHLCKVYGVYDSSEELLCGKFYRLTFLYEHCSYDLEMDLNNRSRLANSHPDKVNIFH